MRTEDLVTAALDREAASLERWTAMTRQEQEQLIERTQAHLVRLSNTVENWLPASCGGSADDPLLLIVDVTSRPGLKSLAERYASRTPLGGEARQVLREVAVDGLLELVADES